MKTMAKSLRVSFAGSFALVAFTVIPALAADTLVLKAVADAYMRSGPEKENVRFGPAAILCVKKSSVATDGFHRESYLTFDLTGAPAIAGGKLRLYCPDPKEFDAADMEIRSSPVTDWTDDRGEKSITWANRPAAGRAVHATGAWKLGWNEWDLTPFLQAEIAAGRNVVTLIVRNTTVTKGLCVMNSREAATNQPELLLVVVAAPPAAPNSEGFADLRVGDRSLDSSGGFAVVADEAQKRIHVVFGTKNRLDYAVSSDGGNTWSVPVQIAASSGMPALAVDRQGTVHVAYAANRELHYRSISAGTWSDPVDLTVGVPGGKTTIVSPRLGVDGKGNVHLLAWTVWRSPDPNWRQGSRAVYCYKRSGSERFDEPQLWKNQRQTPGGYGKHGALCTDAQGNMHLFYLTSDRAASGKITSAIERRIRRPDETWDPRHDVWPLKDDLCDWSLAAALDQRGVVHLSAHRRVSREGADIVYLNNRQKPDELAELFNAGFEPWESWTDILVEPAGDVWLATAHYHSQPDAIGPRGGYYRHDASADRWSARTILPAKDGANLGSRNYEHPRLLRFNEKVHLFYAQKEDGVFRHYLRRFDHPSH